MTATQAGARPAGARRALPPPAGEPSAVRPPGPGRARTAMVLGGLGALALAGLIATVALGSVTIPVREVLAVLTGGEVSREAWSTIVLDVRLPRAVTAALAGAGLGVAGLGLQTLFRNPLAEPFVLGISAGASLGVAAVVLAVGTTGSATLVAGLTALGSMSVAGAAALGAGAVTTLVLAVSRRVSSPATLLIIGLMVGYAVNALVTLLLQAGLGDLSRVRAYIQWGFGSFNGTTWSQLQVLVPLVLAGLAVTWALTKALNALLLGERYAASMGLAVRRARATIIAVAAVLAGVITAFCGPIAFIGIATPHLVRGLLRTSDHRVLVPATAVGGAVVGLAAGLVATLPGTEQTLPLNAVTGLLGAPVVIAVLLRLRRSGQAVSA